MKTLEETRDEANQLGVAFKNSDTKANIEKKIKAFHLKNSLKEGVVPDAQLKAWKAKHGWIQKITVEIGENDTAVGYLRKPTRDHKAIALSLFSQNQILECGEFLLQNCWLGGDERLKDADDIADSAAIQANTIVNFLKGSSERV